MPLHPQAEALLAAAKLLNLPAPSDLDPVEARTAYNRRADAIKYFVDMESAQDRTIPGPAGEIPIRIYRPIDAPANAPALMFFHGGGWVYSTIDSYDKVCRALADEMKAVVISVGYRLAPEDPYPAAADDCLAATRSPPSTIRCSMTGENTRRCSPTPESTPSWSTTTA